VDYMFDMGILRWIDIPVHGSTNSTDRFVLSCVPKGTGAAGTSSTAQVGLGLGVALPKGAIVFTGANQTAADERWAGRALRARVEAEVFGLPLTADTKFNLSAIVWRWSNRTADGKCRKIPAGVEISHLFEDAHRPEIIPGWVPGMKVEVHVCESGRMNELRKTCRELGLPLLHAETGMPLQHAVAQQGGRSCCFHAALGAPCLMVRRGSNLSTPGHIPTLQRQVTNLAGPSQGQSSISNVPLPEVVEARGRGRTGIIDVGVAGGGRQQQLPTPAAHLFGAAALPVAGVLPEEAEQLSQEQVSQALTAIQGSLAVGEEAPEAVASEQPVQQAEDAQAWFGSVPHTGRLHFVSGLKRRRR
jgi:hypothetical protein